MLCATFNRDLYSRFFRLLKNRLRCFFKCCRTFFFLLRNNRFDLLKGIRIRVFKTQIFKFVFFRRHTEPVGKRSPNIDNFLCKSSLFFRRQSFDVADSVEPVGKFYKNDTHIVYHCKKHFAYSVRLLQSFSVYRKTHNPRIVTHNFYNRISEFFAHFIFAYTVIINIVQETCANAVGIKRILSKNKRSPKRMKIIRSSAGAIFSPAFKT